jgi:hypothetical protein
MRIEGEMLSTTRPPDAILEIIPAQNSQQQAESRRVLLRNTNEGAIDQG